ncbi:MAG: hypothetical protein ABSG51_04795, partial [Terracidiphilus sp.]
MKQILHIFLKDARRFWPEILLSLAVCATFVWVLPHQWLGNNDFQSQTLQSLSSLIALLIPLSWWVLIARVIHAERLVGNTQFWVTRPYEWKSLLAAKLAFLVVFLCVPFFFSQYILLAEAGSHPQAYLPGLLFSLLLIAGTIVLPLAALATVTSSFARMTLTILAVLLGLIAVFILLSARSGIPPFSEYSPIGDRLCLALALTACGAAIAMQYALRKSWLPRLVLIALPILLCAAILIAPDHALMNREYPIVTNPAGAPIELSYDPNPLRWSTSSNSGSRIIMIPVEVPVAESGVAEGYAAVVDSVRAVVKAPDGSQWTSAWQPSGLKFLQDKSFTNATFPMPLSEYNKFRSMPVSVRLTLAITQAKVASATSIQIPTGKFSVPDFGVCAPQTRKDAPGNITGITCISPLRKATLTYVETHWSESSCSASPAQSDSNMEGSAWVGSLDRAPAEWGISSVAEVPIFLSGSGFANNKPRILCPGTTLTFVQYSAVRRSQTSIAVENFHLPKVTIAGDQVTAESWRSQS